MSRLPRLVLPGYPHHITQRGVRSLDVFSDDSDRLSYLQFLSEESDRSGVSFLGWCLMANHIQLIPGCAYLFRNCQVVLCRI